MPKKRLTDSLKDKQITFRVTSAQREAIDKLSIALHMDLTEVLLSSTICYFEQLGSGETLNFFTVCKDPKVWEYILEHADDRAQNEREKFNEKADLFQRDQNTPAKTSKKK